MYRIVFDVETVGLHGEAWQVGAVVMDDDWSIVQQVCWTANRDHARGTRFAHEWCDRMCGSSAESKLTPYNLRDGFYALWRAYAQKPGGCEMWADAGWPVEARFLLDVINDDHGRREWEGPYPLHEIGTVIMLKGGDCRQPLPRLADEKPIHHALNDARQSARILKHLMTGGTFDELMAVEEEEEEEA